MITQILEKIDDSGPCCKITNNYLSFEMVRKSQEGYYIKNLIYQDTVDSKGTFWVLWERHTITVKNYNHDEGFVPDKSVYGYIFMFVILGGILIASVLWGLASALSKIL